MEAGAHAPTTVAPRGDLFLQLASETPVQALLTSLAFSLSTKSPAFVLGRNYFVLTCLFYTN